MSYCIDAKESNGFYSRYEGLNTPFPYKKCVKMKHNSKAKQSHIIYCNFMKLINCRNAFSSKSMQKVNIINYKKNPWQKLSKMKYKLAAKFVFIKQI